MGRCRDWTPPAVFDGQGLIDILFPVAQQTQHPRAGSSKRGRAKRPVAVSANTIRMICSSNQILDDTGFTIRRTATLVKDGPRLSHRQHGQGSEAVPAR